ncbi:MAG TPA: hypothetical protein VFP84_22885, partial [Kofleriaceae bacterium]|nr:hypothetical protein [Kofleriaceae bacterium]
MTRAGRMLSIVVGVALGAGCVHNGFTPATAMRLPARPEGCYLDMVFQGEPPDAYVVLGQVTTDSTAPGLFAIGENNDAAMTRMQAQACEVGAHGLMRAGSATHGEWTNNGYSRSTTGSAVAFVYVDEAGRPLPPPTGPRVVIHRGAAAPPPPPVAPPPPPLSSSS